MKLILLILVGVLIYNSEDSRFFISDQLHSSQKDQLIEQYSQIVVDSMDFKSMEQFVYDTMVEFLEKLTDKELEEEIVLTNEQELYDELVDNVTQQYPKQLNIYGG